MFFFKSHLSWHHGIHAEQHQHLLTHNCSLSEGVHLALYLGNQDHRPKHCPRGSPKKLSPPSSLHLWEENQYHLWHVEHNGSQNSCRHMQTEWWWLQTPKLIWSNSGAELERLWGDTSRRGAEIYWSSEVNPSIPVHFSSPIPKRSMFTLAISYLTTSNLPWFMDLTKKIPMQYCFYSTGLCFYHQSHPQLGAAVAPSLHSFWSYFSTDLQ